MCGISGIIKFNKQPVQESIIRRMMQIQKHRGPDDSGIFLEENIGFGFVRLSILDLSAAGHQPMFSQDERFVIIFNGEIFNYIEIREELCSLGHKFKTATDTEVLLAAYIEWNDKCLDRLNGMWAFVIYDRIKKNVFASRDRYGIKPFYYYLTDEFFAFASEIPPLLSLLPGKSIPDDQSIFDYLVFNRTDHTNRTFFKEIKKLQHGNRLVIKDTSVTIEKWYSLRERTLNCEGFQSPEEFRELFSSAVGLRLRSDVPVGVCLSGGLDSSSIVSILLKDYLKKDLKTFSVVYLKGQYGDETEYISEFKPLVQNMFYTTPNAESLASELNEFVKAQVEPIPSTGPYAQYKVMELAKGNVVVTLDGQGADELLAGYHYFYGFLFKDFLLQGNLGKLSKETYHYLIKHRNVYGPKTFLYFLLPERFKVGVRVKEKGYLNKHFRKTYQSENAIARNLYNASTLKEAVLNHFEYKLEHLLKWEDSNSMWFSLESRVPFLDYRLVERTVASHQNLIINKGLTKSILREAMKNTVPEKIRLRKDKMGFDTPQDEWFKTTQWQTVILEILSSETFKQREIIDDKVALNKYQHYLAGKLNISKEIWKWIHLELWFREFID